MRRRVAKHAWTVDVVIGRCVRGRIPPRGQGLLHRDPRDRVLIETNSLRTNVLEAALHKCSVAWFRQCVAAVSQVSHEVSLVTSELRELGSRAVAELAAAGTSLLPDVPHLPSVQRRVDRENGRGGVSEAVVGEHALPSLASCFLHLNLRRHRHSLDTRLIQSTCAVLHSNHLLCLTREEFLSSDCGVVKEESRNRRDLKSGYPRQPAPDIVRVQVCRQGSGRATGKEDVGGAAQAVFADQIVEQGVQNAPPSEVHFTASLVSAARNLDWVLFVAGEAGPVTVPEESSVAFGKVRVQGGVSAHRAAVVWPAGRKVLRGAQLALASAEAVSLVPAPAAALEVEDPRAGFGCRREGRVVVARRRAVKADCTGFGGLVRVKEEKGLEAG